MKIVVVSKGDERRWHTLRLLADANIEASVVVHDKKTAKNVEEVFGNSSLDIVVSRTNNLVDKRNWILDNLVHKDEWFIGMDDNIQYFTAVQEMEHHDFLNTAGPPPVGYASWRTRYNARVTPAKWLKYFKKDISSAEVEDIPLIGVATMENPYFRARRWSNYRFVKTKVFAMCNVGRNVRFKYSMCHDSYISALCVALYGKVLVDSYLHYRCKMYEVGGLGNREDREKKGLLEQMDAIIGKFPGLVTRANKPNSALRFRLCTAKGVNRWRQEHSYL